MGKLFELFKSELERQRNDTIITSVTIVDTDSRKSAASGVARGIAGAALFGGVGAIAGAMSAKNKKETTFRIEYASGRVDVVTFKNGSKEYNKYIRMVDR